MKLSIISAYYRRKMLIQKFTLWVILLLMVNGLTAQNIGGYVTSDDDKYVSYASIYLKNKNIGVVADSIGYYELPNSILSETEDTLVFSCVGYNNEKISILSFKEKVTAKNVDIRLKTNSIFLNEVNVKPNTDKPKEYGTFNLRSTNVFIQGKPSSKLLVFIENTDKVEQVIKTINIKLRKNNDKTKKLRIFFCKKTEDGFQSITLTKGEIIISDLSKSNTKIDVSNYQIPFTEDGIYVGVEWIGIENVVQNLSEKIGLGVVCTAKLEKHYTWIFENDTWKQFPVLTKQELNEIPKIFRKKVSNANAQVGITAY